MSWKSIPVNQTVSRENLQNAVDTGVFLPLSPIPATDPKLQVTKDDVNSYISVWQLNPPFNQAAPNQLPTKGELAVQSNILYAASYNRIYLGNTNRDWIFSLYSADGDLWGSIASTTDNQYILAGRSYTSGAYGGGGILSRDYGETFTSLGAIMTTNDACLAVAINGDGEYMIATRQVGSYGSKRAYIYWSYNGGLNWAVGYHDNTIDYNFNGAAMSDVGVYATVLGSDGLNYYIWRSVSFGSTWTKTILCKGIKVLQGGCVGMSKSGQYQLVTPPQASSPDIGYFYISNDWGITFTPYSVTPIPLAVNDRFFGCSVSANGDYMTVSAFSTTLNQNRTYISSDFGVTWTLVNVGESSYGQAVDSSGQFQYQSGRASRDYGNTWDFGVNALAISVNSYIGTAPYIYGVSNDVGVSPNVSSDQGANFNTLGIGSESNYTFNYISTSRKNNYGKYVLTCYKDNPFLNSYVSFSSDYGNTWSTVYSTNLEVVTTSISDSGVYQVIGVYSSSSNTTYFYKSTNSGVSWSQLGNTDFAGRAVSSQITNDGKYFTAALPGVNEASSSMLVYSDDYLTLLSQFVLPFVGLVTDICMSAHGKTRMVTVKGLSGSTTYGRIYKSTNYGFAWNAGLYVNNYEFENCAMDDTGRVCLVSATRSQVPFALSSIIYYTIDFWENINNFQPTLPIPFIAPVIGGVNISNDATYWTAVAYNQRVSFTSTTGGVSWITNQIGENIYNFSNLSK